VLSRGSCRLRLPAPLGSGEQAGAEMLTVSVTRSVLSAVRMVLRHQAAGSAG